MNQANLLFDITPKLNTLSKMDYSSLFKLNCTTDYTINQIAYKDDKLIVSVDYTKNI
jgi:hypothetical protein